MRHRLLPLAVLVAALLAAMLAPAARTSAQSGESRPPDQVVLQPPAGPALAAAGGYTSPPTAAAHPFTHLLLRREAGVPAGASLALYVRASVDGATWSAWDGAGENDDLWQPDNGPDVEWSSTIAVGAVARYWQVRAEFAPAPDGSLPELRRIDVNTVDASGPAAPPARGFSTQAALAKPVVVSRTAWGNPDGQGSRMAPAYYPVNHMVVHHTADSNTLLPGESDWAARVRAEWRFHTFTRGWGDVGYNYLIDPNGVIYEGRAGGDDAVAFHDTANYGSMGVVLIGTYADVPPTQSAQGALANLLAWKASQKNIDPLGRSYYYGCDISKYCRPFNAGAVVLNIAGHRQVTPGHTTCPGNNAVDILPGIRERVKRLVSDGGGSGGGDNGDLIVDEMESSFARSTANWRDAYCGYSGHTYWTYATDGASQNSATWRPRLPSSGRYRVYAHIPQGCGLGSAPYASTQAVYRIHTAEGDFTRTVDQNTATTWADLGNYAFEQGNAGAVELYDTTGEPIGAGRVLFFDAVKWVPENATTAAEITGVQYNRTTVASGELLKVTFTVRNTGSTTLQGQTPSVDLTAGGGLNNLNNGYVYDQDECFAGNDSGSYPAYPKEDDRFRVVLGTTGWDGSGNGCVGATSDYPWRWGLNADLAPGQQQTIVGYVRFREPGVYQLQAGLVQEYVQYYQQGLGRQAIAVTSERSAPDAAAYDASVLPLARVYQLGDIPDNFLARTRNPLSIPRGEFVGSFAWDGRFVDWGDGGPLGLTDQFLVEQTRVFLAPTSGEYTFRATTDDGSWLWVDGQAVVINNGLHPADDATGTIWLNAGVHVLAFKYFERSGYAAAGYDVQAPDAAGFYVPIEGLGGGALRLGATFVENPLLSVTADDQGGAGVDRVRWSWDGVNWQESAGATLSLGRLANSSYRLRYQAVDRAGNAGEVSQLVFAVNTNLSVRRVYLPVVGR
jgi:hypothetical protein